MDFSIRASAQQYLADLNQTQAQINQAQAQVSSGLKVQKASDDPSAVSEILQLQTTLAQNQQIQSNLGGVSTELSTADSSLQTAIQALQSALSIGQEGANSSTTADTRSNLAQQIAGLQQTLVGITQTTVDGRYIFSGDRDSQAPYQLDSTQPEGVLQLVTGGATRVIQDANGTSIPVARTAQQIFDPKNPDGTAAAGNTFAAINSLLTALQNNDSAGIGTAVTSLQAASGYLNDQLAFYGEAENQVSTATTLAKQFNLQETSNLSQLLDADVPTAALELTQAQTQQQAELSVAAKIQQAPNLFSLLG